ncbi:formyltransferase family protein [Candidatus Nardonella dryophthoridicola]|uniref:formyltransferase family protein n=1 Tax=Candidatus Nardonella dryophthoridicola TaxID=1971485 RepID=UPI001AD89C82|nr:formyltransferase family protein [Candidatus Nardonella dryophthoridicola]QTJ62872.1 hypothetical protein JRY34_01085 [Candidatus Nardonella dryophthoridicola]
MINIIFAGSDLFSLINIIEINKIKLYNIVYIILKDIKKKNKEINSIINFSKENNIKILYINKYNIENKISINIINNNKIKLIIISSFGIIFPDKILNIVKYGFINIHASILPKYIGPSPIYNTIINKDKISGITIFKINKIIDNGEIIFRSYIKIKKNENYYNLYIKLAKFSSFCILKILRNILLNKKILKIDKCLKINIKKKITKKIHKYESKINFNNNIKKIDLKIRLFNYKIKSFFIYKNINIKIIKHEYIFDKNINNEIKKIYLINNYGIYIKVNKGLIVLKKIQFPNKNPTTIKDLINSKKIKIFKKDSYIDEK